MKSKHSPAIVGLIILLTLLSNRAMAGGKLDDAAIFAIFDQTNTADVWAGRIAAKKAHSQEVRELGKMVATDHEAVQQSWRDLAKKLGIIPAPPANDTSAQKLAQSVALLQSKSGREFDRVYLENEIAFHGSVIDAIKSKLLPAIQNDEFRALVTQALPGFEHHLAETKAVAAKMGIK